MAPDAQKLSDTHDNGNKTIFISYNHADQQWAVWIAWLLEEAGYTVIVQVWDFSAGSNFVLEMDRATKQSDQTIILLSPSFLRSGFTAAEWSAAFAKDPTGVNRKMIPLMVEKCRPEGLLSQVVWRSLVGLDKTQATATVLAAVRAKRNKPTIEPPFPNAPGPGDEPNFPGCSSGVIPSPEKASTEVTTGLDSNVADRVKELDWGVPNHRKHEGWSGHVWLGACFVPETRSSEYLPDLTLGDPVIQNSLLSLLMDSVFQRSRSTSTNEFRDHLEFRQVDGPTNRIVAMARFHIDGSLVVGSILPQKPTSHGYSMVNSVLVDEDAVRSLVVAGLNVAGSYFGQIELPPSSLSLGISLSDFGSKHLGRLPSQDIHSFTIGSPNVSDPLRIPQSPLTVRMSQLASPDALANELMQRFIREFRLESAYYVP